MDGCGGIDRTGGTPSAIDFVIVARPSMLGRTGVPSTQDEEPECTR